MKKIISLILALVLVFALSFTAFAEDGTYTNRTPLEEGETAFTPGTGTTNSEDVTAAYQAAVNEAATVYYFTIKWENTANDLKYTGAKGVYIWDGASMRYSKDIRNSKDAEWTGSAAYKVTVTNQSNSSIYATTTASNERGLTLSSENWTNKELTTADDGLVTNGANGLKIYNVDDPGHEVADSITYTYAANDTATAPEHTTTGKTTVGTITITVKDTNE